MRRLFLSGEPFSKEDLFCDDFLFIYFFAGKKMPCGKPSVKSFFVLVLVFFFLGEMTKKSRKKASKGLQIFFKFFCSWYKKYYLIT